MLKELFRIILKQIFQLLILIVMTPYILIIWLGVRIKLFIEEASEKKIELKKQEWIEFWRYTWEIKSIDCMNLKQLRLYNELRKNYKKGKLTKISKNDMRNIGKTTMLIKIALKEDIPIAVPYKSWEKYLKDKYKDVKVVVFNDINSVRGMRFNGILFEEGFEEGDLKEILNYLSPTLNNFTGYTYQ